MTTRRTQCHETYNASTDDNDNNDNTLRCELDSAHSGCHKAQRLIAQNRLANTFWSTTEAHFLDANAFLRFITEQELESK